MRLHLRTVLASLVLAWACALPALADSSEPYPFPSYISLNVQPFAYVNNQLSNGFSVVPEPQVNVTITFRLADVPMILNQQVGEFAYYHPAGSVGNVPPPGSHFVGAENVLEYNIQQSIGIGVAPGWFLEGSQLYRTSNEFVDMIGLGVAGEKIPDFRRRTSLYGRLAFYPKWVNEDAIVVPHSRHQIPVNYIGFQFLAGAMSRIGRGNGYLNYGVQGEYFSKTVNAPANLIKLIPFAGYALRVL